LRGILVPDPRIKAANITPKDHATAGLRSDYTAAGPFPGTPAPDQDTDLILRTSGSQSADGQIDIRTQRAGAIGVEGAGFVWRAPATSSAWFGLDAPGLVTGWEVLRYTAVANGVNVRPTVRRLQSGKLLAVYHVSAVGVVQIKRYDPATSAWTSVNLVPTGAAAGYLTGAVSICQLTSGRVLAFCLSAAQQQVDMYYTDDDGGSWTVGGYRILGDGVDEATVTDIRAEYSPENNEIALFVLWTDSGATKETVTQYASADLGTGFTKILNNWQTALTEEVLTLDLVPMVGGGFCVVYHDKTAAPDNLQRRRIGSAFTSIDTATAAEPDSGITCLDGPAIWRDETDVMWLFVGDGRTSFPLGALYRSENQGDSWANASSSAGTHSLNDASTLNAFKDYACASVAGRTALVARWRAATATHDEQSVGVLWYSGFSKHTAPGVVLRGSLVGDDYRDLDYAVWGRRPSAAGDAGWFYAPIELPGNLAWTATGAGSESLVSAGALEVTTTVTSAATRAYTRAGTADGSDNVFLEFEVAIDSGDGDTATNRIAAKIQWGDNSTKSYEVEIRLASGAYRVYDTNASANVGSEQALDFTTFKRIRVVISESAAVKTWYATSAHAMDWTEGPGGTGLTVGAAATIRLVWGHLGTLTDVSRWTTVGVSGWCGLWAGNQSDSLGESWSPPEHLKPAAYPSVPAIVHDGVKIQAISGPTVIGETQSINTAYEHPIGNIFPTDAPSPSRGWKATADSAVYEIVVDLEAAGSHSFFESSTIGVFLVESNLKSATLQRSADGSSWTTIATLDSTSGYTGLRYNLYGTVIEGRIGAPVPTNGRWSPHDMHSGDTVELEAGEGTALRKIVSNSAGGWNAGKFARMRVESVDGTEDADGFCNIRRRNFGGIVHNFSSSPRYIRLLIPSQAVEGGKYEIGQLLIGPVFVFGLQHGDGHSYESKLNTELSTRDSGVRSSRVRGKRRRAVEISWSAQPQDTTRMWDSEPNPDYVTGVDGGDPVASVADTAYQVLGLAERTEGSGSPVVYLSTITRGTGTHLYEMDPQWLYGRITTEAPSIDHVVGDDGVSPVVRGNVLRIEEEV
jgi:hypothetical protein